MKILQSKYYQPINYFVADRFNEFKVVTDTNQAKRSPYHHTLKQKLQCISFNDCDIVIEKNKLKNLVKCTDFTYLKFSKNGNQFYEEELCYFYPDCEIFIILSQDLSNDYDVQLFENNVYKVSYIFYDATQDNIKHDIEQFFADYLQKYMLGEKISILVKESDYFELKTHKIKPLPINLQQMYNEGFAKIHQHIQHSLMTKNKGVLLLHGKAGTGKTNYIKWLITQVPDKKFIFVPTTIIHQLTDPAFIGILLQNKDSVLVLEDCENYIAERHFENKNTDVVSSILNLADGILSDMVECQIICTFNAKIDSIDSALLRKGRLIAEYKFEPLTIKQANAYLASIDSKKTTDKPLTLAELTNIDQQDYKEKPKEKSFGFV